MKRKSTTPEPAQPRTDAHHSREAVRVDELSEPRETLTKHGSRRAVVVALCKAGVATVIAFAAVYLLLFDGIWDVGAGVVFGMIAAPTALLAFSVAHQRVREADQLLPRTVRLRRGLFLVTTPQGETSYPLRTCRWFRGFTFHDAMAKLCGVRRAVVLSFAPHRTCRFACGLTPELYDRWVEQLISTGIPESPQRIRYERTLVVVSGVAGAALGAGFLLLFDPQLLGAWIPLRVPQGTYFTFPPLCGYVAVAWLRSFLGDPYFDDEPVLERLSPWIAFAFIGPLKGQRRGGERIVGAGMEAILTYAISVALQLAVLLVALALLRSFERSRQASRRGRGHPLI